MYRRRKQKIEKPKKNVNSREGVWKMFLMALRPAKGQELEYYFLHLEMSTSSPFHTYYSGKLIMQIMSVSTRL
jgi:hypothetical protein